MKNLLTLLFIYFGLLFFGGGVFAQTISGGICAEYANYISPPDYNQSEVVVEEIDTTINFNWGAGGYGAPVNNDNFFIRWTGKVAATTTGLHTFRTRSDDGVRVYLNGSLIINNRTDHGPTFNYSAPISMFVGQEVDLLVEYYENGGGAVMQLARETPISSGYEVVPSSSLYSLDTDNDGVVDCEDCDPNDSGSYPGNTEICDGKDNDCDGQIDEGCGRRCDDDDNDGHVTGAVYSLTTTSGYEKLCTSVPNINGGGCVGGVVGAGFTMPICGQECTPSDGRTSNYADSDNLTYPGAPELCDINISSVSGYMTDHEWDQDCTPGSFNTLDDSDSDGDVVPACADNCIDIANANQLDSNGYMDGVGEGDACEIFCGNGVVAVDEECDDGNIASGDGCSVTCEIEYCRDDAPLNDTSKSFVLTDATGSLISGTSTQSNSKVAICFEDTTGSRDLFYTSTDAGGAFTFVPTLGPYIAPWINVGVMLHDENDLDIDHHAIMLLK